MGMTSTTALFLVEDDALIRDLLETSLTDAGFEVVEVSCGTKALAHFDADAARFRAVITDIRLGVGPDGWAVARRARELVPTMPVVYMSGDSSPEWSSKGVPNSLMVAKPFAPAQIITAVSTLLNAADTH
jgi:DNA-binding response OmpR family regulator